MWCKVFQNSSNEIIFFFIWKYLYILITCSFHHNYFEMIIKYVINKKPILCNFLCQIIILKILCFFFFTFGSKVRCAIPFRVSSRKKKYSLKRMTQKLRFLTTTVLRFIRNQNCLLKIIHRRYCCIVPWHL